MRALWIILMVGFAYSSLGFAFDQVVSDEGDEHCTPWVKQQGVTCIFNGQSASSWKRHCSDWKRVCREHAHHECDNEHFCAPRNVDPNNLNGACTDWYRYHGVNCVDRNIGRDAARYSRACVKGHVATIRCGTYEVE